jgi:hypothetical protein
MEMNHCCFHRSKVVPERGKRNQTQMVCYICYSDEHVPSELVTEAVAQFITKYQKDKLYGDGLRTWSLRRLIKRDILMVPQVLLGQWLVIAIATLSAKNQ